MSTSLDHLLDNFNIDMSVDMGEVNSGVVPTPTAVPNPSPSSAGLAPAAADQVPSISPEFASLPTKDSGPSLKELPAVGKKRSAEEQTGASSKHFKKKKSSKESLVDEAPRFAAWTVYAFPTECNGTQLSSAEPKGKKRTEQPEAKSRV